MTAPAVTPATAYQRLLLQARARGFAAGRAELDRITRSLRLAADQLDAIATRSGPLTATAERAATLRRETLDTLRILETRLAATGQQSVNGTVSDILGLHERSTVQLLEATGRQIPVGMSARFDQLNRRVLTVLAARRGGTARTYQTLIHRHLLEAAPALDTLLEAGIARGASIDSLARDVARMLEGFSPLTPGLRSLPLGGLSSIRADARMIARTETMNALREGNAYGMVTVGVVQAVQWTLNSAHAVEDECLRGEALILTASGLRSIAEIRVGEMVVTHLGRLRRVLATSRKPCGVSGLRQVVLRAETSCTLRISATPNHPVLTAEGWCPVGDLRTGTLVRCAPVWRAGFDLRHADDRERTVQPGSVGSARTRDKESDVYSRCGGAPSAHRYIRIPRTLVAGAAGPNGQRQSADDGVPCLARLASSGFLLPAAHGRTVPESLLASTTASPGAPSLGTKGRSGMFDWRWLDCIAHTRGEDDAWSHTDILGSTPLTDERRSPSSEGSARHSGRTTFWEPAGASPEPSTDESRIVPTAAFAERGDARFPDSHVWSAAEFRMSHMVWACVESNMPHTDHPIVYNLQVKEDGSYIADGVVVHNCDVLAEADLYGFGPGFYPPDRWPIGHIQCGCYQGAVQMRPASQWGRPMEASRVPDIDVDALIGERGWSAARQAHAARVLAQNFGVRTRAA